MQPNRGYHLLGKGLDPPVRYPTLEIVRLGLCAYGVCRTPPNSRETFHDGRRYRHLLHKGRTQDERKEYSDFSKHVHCLDLHTVYGKHRKASQPFRQQRLKLPFLASNVHFHYLPKRTGDNTLLVGFPSEFLPVHHQDAPYHRQRIFQNYK